ncbi:EamA family transporter [Nakamurella lactea]|uniref:EamA family transporter n=1 Tax=Nakamurella lactea TaxID=459515 RepID=UPI0012B50F83|nr:EamA family transporter [Nakamurella lactea]
MLSSLAHAGWNTLVKRVSAAGVPAMWAYTLAASVLLVPLTVVATAGHAVRFTGTGLLLAPVSMALHTAYAALVQRAYRSFDVGQVYPLSRGLAPVLVAVPGVTLFDQGLTPARWVGVALMGISVALLTFERSASLDPARNLRPVLWSTGIAVTIAAYTLYDGWAVVTMQVDPMAYYLITGLLQLGLMTMLIRHRIPEGVDQFRQHTASIVTLAVLIPASYLFGLYATQHAPISLVAAVRSTSLIWAAIAATMILREPLRRSRILATVAAVAALALLAI